MTNILCYGDSNTYGYIPGTGGRYPKDVRWTGRLQKILGDDFNVVEEGCNSRTTVFPDPGEPWLNGETYLRPCLKSHKPLDIVIIMLGTNDLKFCFGASPSRIADGAGTLVDIVRQYLSTQQSYLPRIILISPPIVLPGVENSFDIQHYHPEAAEASHEFAGEYLRVAGEKKCEYLDAASVTGTSSVDCIHLTADDHRRLADLIAEKILHCDR